MRQVEYTDERGRKYIVSLPDNVPDSEADKGILIGPPDVVDNLGLHEPLATRLHNELFANKLWNIKIVRRQPKLLFGILHRVLKVDVHRLMSAYMELERK